jgi:hypothetical protein
MSSERERGSVETLSEPLEHEMVKIIRKMIPIKKN